MRFGATGHQELPPRAVEWIASEIETRLLGDSVDSSLIGYTSLAAGADQLFARTIIKMGGELRVVVPSSGYEETFVKDKLARDQYRSLLRKAHVVEHLPFEYPGEAAFMAAGQRIVDCSDQLIAIWDGEPARGFGGTADVVSYAKGAGKEVIVIWPQGTRRS
jgi:hypothetical protein